MKNGERQEEESSLLHYEGGEAHEALVDDGDNDKQIDEKENTCCCCIYLPTGIKILAILSILGCILNSLNIFAIGTEMQTQALINLVVSMPNFVGAYWFYQWWRNDTKETRANLPKAIIISMILCAIMGLLKVLEVTGVTNFVFESNDLLPQSYRNQEAIGTVIGFSIVMAINFYYYRVTQKFASQF